MAGQILGRTPAEDVAAAADAVAYCEAQLATCSAAQKPFTRQALRQARRWLADAEKRVAA